MPFVDTSAFYAYLSRHDLDHARARAAFRTVLLAGEPLLATSYVLAETLGLLQRRLGMRVVSRFAADMLPLVTVRWMGAADHAAAWRLHQEVRKRSFTIVDASSAALMAETGVRSILAFDPEFVRLGFETLL